MNLPPLLAKRGESGAQSCLDAGDRGPRESVVFPQFRGSVGTVEIKYASQPRTNDVHVCWPMIIGINDDPKPINSVDRRHTILYTKT